MGLLGTGYWVRADLIDDTVTTLMAKRHIPGLSLAIVQDGAIVRAQAYGVIDLESKQPVATSTLFQAGSVSKPVAALGALALVEAGKISLDADVNGFLKTWQVPENEFTGVNKVTLRRLLSHSAGITVHGFPGYAVDAQMPSLVSTSRRGSNGVIRAADIWLCNRWCSTSQGSRFPSSCARRYSNHSV
jgi:CubicO group peptidase (beta-lactamase class C family)